MLRQHIIKSPKNLRAEKGTRASSAPVPNEATLGVKRIHWRHATTFDFNYLVGSASITQQQHGDISQHMNN